MPTADQLDRIENQLLILNSYLRKRTSFAFMFAHAVVQGIGYVIGATIFAGIVIAILVRVIGTIDYVPILNQVINSQQVQETFIDDLSPSK